MVGSLLAEDSPILDPRHDAARQPHAQPRAEPDLGIVFVPGLTNWALWI
jgi:hypothetical protein